jgi:hypothetical protein
MTFTPAEHVLWTKARTEKSARLRRNLTDEAERRLMISPGVRLHGVKGRRRLVEALGVFQASKKLNEEASNTFFSKNIFLAWSTRHGFTRTAQSSCTTLVPPRPPRLSAYMSAYVLRHRYWCRRRQKTIRSTSSQHLTCHQEAQSRQTRPHDTEKSASSLLTKTESSKFCLKSISSSRIIDTVSSIGIRLT